MCHSKDEWTVRKIRIDTSRMTRHGRKCGKAGCAESAPAEKPGEVSGEGARGGMAMDGRGPGHHGLDRRKGRTCLHRQCGHPPRPTKNMRSLPWPTPAHNTCCVMREVSPVVRLRRHHVNETDTHTRCKRSHPTRRRRPRRTPPRRARGSHGRATGGRRTSARALRVDHML